LVVFSGPLFELSHQFEGLGFFSGLRQGVLLLEKGDSGEGEC
jgi:hypothetical protein